MTVPAEYIRYERMARDGFIDPSKWSTSETGLIKREFEHNSSSVELRPTSPGFEPVIQFTDCGIPFHCEAQPTREKAIELAWDCFRALLIWKTVMGKPLPDSGARMDVIM